MQSQIDRCRLHLAATLWIAAIVTATSLLNSASAESTVTVTHPKTAPPTYIDNGTPGESIGDVRIFQFDATGDDGGVVRTDWIMTTTGIDTPEKNVDSRVTLGVFSFDGELKNQLLLQGVAFYPDENATLKPSSSTVRAIIGGTGKYAGAVGWVESFHLDDGSWRHVFHIEN